MHPTIDEQLDGALRLLGKVRDDPALTPGSRALLTNVHRLISQVSRSHPDLAAFHHEDNERLAALLPPLLSSEQSDRLHALGADGHRPFDQGAIARRNAGLRALLSEVIETVPRRPDADSVRPALVECLKRRLGAGHDERRVAP